MFDGAFAELCNSVLGASRQYDSGGQWRVPPSRLAVKRGSCHRPGCQPPRALHDRNTSRLHYGVYRRAFGLAAGACGKPPKPKVKIQTPPPSKYKPTKSKSERGKSECADELVVDV